MAVGVLCLFLMVPWVGLQCVNVAFPGHTYLRVAFQIHLVSMLLPPLSTAESRAKI